MVESLLSLCGVCVGVEERTILRDVDLTVRSEETHILFGPNGSGKSSLLSAIMGLPPYRVTTGEICFAGERIDSLPVDARARLGLGMAFQRPPALDGVTVAALGHALGADTRLASESNRLDLSGFEARGINVGFSGGEIKRWEILKLILQGPRLCLFDEPESGVDLEHIAAVGTAIERLLRPTERARRAALIITHTGFILEYLRADMGHLLVDGRIVCSGDPEQLFQHIKQHGYTVPPPPAVLRHG